MSNETVYRMGGESVPASKLPDWHHARELPWGTGFRGPAPVTIRRMSRRVLNNISVHLADYEEDPDNEPSCLNCKHSPEEHGL